MKTITALLAAIVLGAATTIAADSPEFTAILTKVDGASKELIAHTRALESTVSSQSSEIGTLKQQLAAEQSARAKAEAERDAAVAARIEAKAQITAVASKL